MFYIENSNILLFGRSVTYYAVMPIIAALAIAFMSVLFAKAKKMDPSFTFRVSALIFFPGAILVLIMPSSSQEMLTVMFFLAVTILLTVYVIIGILFHKEPKKMLQLGAMSYFVFSIFSKLGCFLTGCCCGAEYDGVFSVKYGVKTQNPHPGTTYFPIQLLLIICFLILLVISICVFKRTENVWVTIGMTSIYMMTYYIFVHLLMRMLTV